MNARERFIGTLLFQNSGPVPFQPGEARESTLRAWHGQGLPQGRDWKEALCEAIGIPLAPANDWGSPAPDFTMRPRFEEKVLERRAGSLVVQDWKGNVCEISDQYDVSYLRSARDFVTRSWIKCPVTNRDEWEAMKARYRADDPGRFPADWEAATARLANRSHMAGIVINGPFWQMREWLGFEELCMRFLTEPDLTADMAAFWSDFVAELLEKMLERFVPDAVIISEDMAYKVKAMISPALTREYCLPLWKRWGAMLQKAGCPVYAVDSDGYVGDLIPLWIEAGFHANWPVEVAAGNDIRDFRRQYGRRMAYLGGVDKRAMARGGAEIKEEIRRLEPVIRDGGYIPECDHGIPPDVSWPRMIEYGALLARATGWL